MQLGNPYKHALWHRDKCKEQPLASRATFPLTSPSAKERSMTLLVPAFGLKQDHLKDELGKEGGNDRWQSRGLGHMKNQAPQKARPRKSQEDPGKLTRKIAYVKIPQTLIVISGLNEFQFVLFFFWNEA